MNRVQGVSLPRTGHNMLVIHLKQYFGEHVDCPKYKNYLLPALAKHLQRSRTADDARTSTFHYCEYYYSCRSHQCVDADNKFQKSHDFDLDHPIDNAVPHIVQTREPIALLISWFEMRLAKNRETDSVAGWQAFVNEKLPYVDGFLRKWQPVAESNGLLIDYEEYLLAPDQWLEKAVRVFIGEQTEVNQRKIKRIVSDVRPTKVAADFRFYDSTPESARMVFTSPS